MKPQLGAPPRLLGLVSMRLLVALALCKAVFGSDESVFEHLRRAVPPSRSPLNPAPVREDGWLPEIVQVSSILGGSAAFKTDSGPWQQLQQGHGFHEEVSIQTDTTTKVELTFLKCGIKVSVAPDSEVRFDRLRYRYAPGQQFPTTTLLHLGRGRIRGAVLYLPAGSSYTVVGPRVEWQIEGARYDLMDTGWLLMLDGSAKTTIKEKSFTVKTGEVFDPDNLTVHRFRGDPPPRVIGSPLPLEDLCEVHHVPMLWKESRIDYGLINIPRGYQDAEQHLFPNGSRMFGGCEFVNSSRPTKSTWRCPECEAASDAWWAAHSPPRQR